MYKPVSANKNTLPKLLSLLLAVLLVVLNIVRMIKVPVTHDEGWTYLDYIRSTYRNIWVGSPISANNHILNSLIAKFFVFLFHSSSQFILRLPNLLAQVVYITCSYMLLQKLFKNAWWVLAGLALLNLNPFLFDFWGLCRGYGLAIALMMSGIYLFIQYDDKHNLSYLFASLFAMGLATLSNFSMLNVYLSLIAVIALQALLVPPGLRKKQILRAVSAIIVCSLLLYIIIVQPIIELREKHELYFGGEKGFLADTVKSLVGESLFMDGSVAAVQIITAIIVLLSFFAAVICAIRIFKNDSRARTGLYLVLLLLLPILSTILQHHLFGTLYLIERTALFFYPLFILVLVVALYKARHLPWASSTILLFIVAASVYNFGKNINLSYTRTWEYDRYNRIVLDRIAANTPYPARIKPYWMFINSLKYYAETSYKKEIAYIENRMKDSVYTSTQYDYYYIHRDDLSKIPEMYIYDTSFFDGKYILFRKR